MATKQAIGIDLGTSYCSVAVFQHGKVEVIANDRGNKITPSFVAFTDTDRLIGDAAADQCLRNPTNTVFGVKRLIGRKFDDPEVQEDTKHWPFKVIRDGDKPKIEVEYKNENTSFSPEEISSMLLAKMKEMAEQFLGSPVTDAVITVPAYFNDSQRQSTRDAGTMAGMNVRRIINEPTAAALAYGLDKKIQEERRFLVFDFGGGTVDVTILLLYDGVFGVESTAGNTHLGGGDFDNRMVDYFAKEFNRKHGKDLQICQRAMVKLRAASESAKKTLDASTQAVIEIDSLFEGIDFKSTITRDQFEDICADLFDETLKPVEKALRDAKMDRADIDDIVLVGGSTRIPKIRRQLQDFFDGKELNKSINPEESVAYGAAVLPAIRSGSDSLELQDILLLDVASHSLGIENPGGVMQTMIKRNTIIPCRQDQTFSTTEDNQTSFPVHVYEGESGETKCNNLLGAFELKGIAPALKGKAEIEVAFSVDENGFLAVTASERSTGKEEKLKINQRGKLPMEDKRKKLEDADADVVASQVCIMSKEAKEQSKNSLLTDELSSVKAQKAMYKTMADQLTKDMKELKTALADLNAENQSLKQKYEALKADKEEVDELVDGLASRFSDFMRIQDHWKKRVALLENRLFE